MGNKETRRAIGLLFFTCGLPFGLQTEAMPLVLQAFALSPHAIGRASLLQLAWTIKPLWAPLIDRTGSLSRWLWLASCSLAVGFFGLALAVWSQSLLALLAALLLTSVASATLEATADAALVRITARGGPLRDAIGGLRMVAFKSGLTLGCGLCIVAAGMVGWALPLGAVGVWALCASFGFVPFAKTLAPLPMQPPGEWRLGMARWLKQPLTAWLLLYAATYKLALTSVAPMAKVVWFERADSLVSLGLLVAVLGLLGNVVGASLATLLTTRGSLSACLLAGSALEVVAPLVDALTVHFAPMGSGSWPFLAGCLLVESLAQGLTTTALILLMLRHTERAFAATQFSILSATFGIGRAAGGVLGGSLVGHFGAERSFVLAAGLAAVSLWPMRALGPLLGRAVPSDQPGGH